MIMKIRATIDLDANSDMLDDMGSPERGVYGVDKDGVYHMYYGSQSYMVEFKDVEEIK